MLKNSNRRWLTLVGDTLSWYESADAEKPRNSVSLLGAVASAVESEAVRSARKSSVAAAVSSPAPPTGARFAFTVKLADQAEHAALHLEVETEAERAEWLAVLPAARGGA